MKSKGIKKSRKWAMMRRVQSWTSGASWNLKHFQVNLHVSEVPSHAKSQLLSALADEKDLRGLCMSQPP